MITDDEKFIEIQSILALSDIHPADCTKINNLIIELSKENKQLKDNWNKLKEIMEEETREYWDTDILEIMQELEQGSDK